MKTHSLKVHNSIQFWNAFHQRYQCPVLKIITLKLTFEKSLSHLAKRDFVPLVFAKNLRKAPKNQDFTMASYRFLKMDSNLSQGDQKNKTLVSSQKSFRFLLRKSYEMTGNLALKQTHLMQLFRSLSFHLLHSCFALISLAACQDHLVPKIPTQPTQ